MAPPLFSVAVTWPILERIWEYIDTDRFPPEVLLTQVHYTEHLVFHRPLRPGDHLTVQGKIAAVLPHRAGTRVVICFEALDQKGQKGFYRTYRGLDAGGVLHERRAGGGGPPGDSFGPGSGQAPLGNDSPHRPPAAFPLRRLCQHLLPHSHLEELRPPGGAARDHPPGNRHPGPGRPGDPQPGGRRRIPGSSRPSPAALPGWSCPAPRSGSAWWGKPPGPTGPICILSFATRKDSRPSVKATPS